MYARTLENVKSDAAPSVNEYLRETVVTRGWTIPRLPDACDVAVGLAQRWVSENPRYRVTPNPRSCEKIAAALDIDPDYLLEMAGHRHARTERAHVVDDPGLAAVTAAWPRLDDGLRRAIQILARSGQFGRHKSDETYQTDHAPTRRPSRSVASMIAEFGLQPAY
jgi:transcriptional regulator with XRE-family HTH domain